MNKAATATIKIPTALRNLHKYGANALKPTKLINTTQARQRWKKPYVSKRIANTLRKKAIREGTYGTYDSENGIGWDKDWDNCATFDKNRGRGSDSTGNSVGVGAGKSYNEVDITGAILAKAAARLKARNNLKINTNIDVNIDVNVNTVNTSTENTSMDIINININPNANTNNIMNGGNIKYMDLRKPKETKRERTREARAKKIEDMLLNADDKILEYRLKQKEKKPEPGIEALIKRQMRVA